MKEKIKALTRALKEMWVYFVVYIQLKHDELRLAFAIFMAKQLQKSKNKRFYVIENAKGKLIWLCNEDIKVMKKPRKVRKYINGKFRTFKFYMIPPKTTHMDIMRDCLYYTPESWNNKNGMTVEERNQKSQKWLSYLEQKRLDRMFGKLKLS